MKNDYLVAQKVLHWLMGIVLILDLFVAQKFGGSLEILDRLDSRIDHASLGTTLLILFIVRLALRMRYGAPARPSGMSDWQIKLAKLSHTAMYILMACLFVTGIATAINATDPLPIYGALDITRGNTEESVFQFVRRFHEIVTVLIIVFIVLHVFAALYHQFVLKDSSTVKMLKFWKSYPG